MRCYRLALLCIFVITAIAPAQPVRKPRPGAGGAVEVPPADDGKLPDGVRLRLGTSKFRDVSYIPAAALSPDGKVVAIGNGSQMIRFIDVATGKELRRLGFQQEYFRYPQFFWSPDGTQIIYFGGNGIVVADAKDGHVIRRAGNPDRTGQEGGLQVSEDCKFAVIGHQYQNGTVRVVDLTTGSQVCAVKPEQNAGVFGALSPKGETLATWGQHYNRGGGKTPEEEQQIARTIQLWDAQEGKEKTKLVSEIFQLQSVKFSPDGSKLAAGGNGTVQLWDVPTGKLERRFAGRTGQGNQLVFSPDGKILSAAGQDGCVQSWDIPTGKRTGICEGPGGVVGGMRYRPDGQLVAWSANVNALEIWEVPSGKRLTPTGGHTAPVSALRFSDDGKTLISCGNDGKFLRWDTATGAELGPFELREAEARRRLHGVPRQVGPSHFSPNGKYLVAAGTNGGVASVWDVDAGLELFALTSPQGYVDRGGIIAFSGDSTKLIAMNRYGGREASLPIPIWDLESGSPMPPLKGQRGDFTCAGFSTDGNILVTAAYFYQPQGGQLTEAWAWDMRTGKVLSKVQGPQNSQIMGIQFLDHRLYVLFTPVNLAPGQNAGWKIYDAVTGREVRSLELPKEYANSNMQPGPSVLSPDRRLLAFAPQTNYYGPNGVYRMLGRVVLWEVASGSIRQELSTADGHVTALEFSRDSKMLAGGCSDTTIYLWDVDRKFDKPAALTAADLDALWKTLEVTDAKKAATALQTLVARSAEAVPFLKEHVKPVEAVKRDPERIRKLIADLDAPRYAVREAAMRDLERIGHPALEPVREELKKTALTAELRERLEKVADAVNKPDTEVEWLRPLRAVEALERIGNADALAHLKAVAGGGDAPPTRAAKEALNRLGMK
jgi:WD40 repeat protein